MLAPSRLFVNANKDRDDPRSNDPLAQLRVEFTLGLPDRLEKIRGGLMALLDGFGDAHAEQFHVAAHSLVGMAATFEVHDVAQHAHVLAQLGRRWRKEGAASDLELRQAQEGVDRLDDAIRIFMDQTDGGTARE